MSIKNTLPPAVIFDWDNTLIDTFPLLVTGSNLVREKLGYPLWNDSEARANIRLAGKESFINFYGKKHKDAEAIFYNYIEANHLKNIEVMNGAHALLLMLREAGVPMAVLSNKRGHILRREVAHLGWNDFFEVVHGPDDVGHIGKPNPQGLSITIAKMKLEPLSYADIWYVGDTENDIKAAQAAGVTAVYLQNHAMSDVKEIEELAPKYSFLSCMECLDYLRGLVNSTQRI
jgi:phosphoglycolate phosphatase